MVRLLCKLLLPNIANQRGPFSRIRSSLASLPVWLCQKKQSHKPASLAALEEASRDRQGTRYPCALDGCEKSFKSQTSAQIHFNAEHSGIRLPCAFEGCSATFASARSAKAHFRCEHTGVKYPCTAEGCSRIFKSKQQRSRHIKRIHKSNKHQRAICKNVFKNESALQRCHLGQRVRYKCPGAEEYNCDKTFDSMTGPVAHYKTLHLKTRHKCPGADEFDCERTFRSKQTAELHYHSFHLKTRYPCPEADQFDCDKVFSHIVAAAAHGRTHTHRFPCLRPNCTERFVTALEAWDHTIAVSHKLKAVYTCPIQDCPTAITGKRLVPGSARLHWHTQHADLSGEEHTGFGEMVRSEVLPWGGPGNHALFFHLLADVAMATFPWEDPESRDAWNVYSQSGLPDLNNIESSLDNRGANKSIYLQNINVWRKFHSYLA